MSWNYNLFANTTQVFIPSPLYPPYCYFLLNFSQFCLARVNLGKQQKTYSECLQRVSVFSAISSSPQCCSSSSNPCSLYLIRQQDDLLLRLCSPAPQCGNCLRRISEVSVELTCVLLFSQALLSLKSSWVGCSPMF